jgi:uncharacterized protein with FMN-binding domain
MRKSIVAILAVAIIGALGVYNGSHKTNASTAIQSDNTVTNSSPTSSDTTTSTTPSPASQGSYKDGTYKGQNEDTPYGPVQISIVVSGGRITGVNFLQMPSDLGHSQEVTAFAEPLLKNSTLSKQTAHIDFVSGATQTSEGYMQSLQSALDQAA